MSRRFLFELTALVILLTACATPPTPTLAPTVAPTVAPTAKPTDVPKPTITPTIAPTIAPTVPPTAAPTAKATDMPKPTITSALASTRNAVVDASYSGAEGTAVNGVKTFRKIASALDDAPANATQPYVIGIAKGRYYEKLTIAKPFITLIGEGSDNTIITYDTVADTKKPDGTTYGTAGSATVTVSASNLRVENLTIENGFDYSANAAKAADDPTKIKNTQAVALRTDKGNDKAFFKNVRLLGNQDTLYANAGTHYFEKCYIAGNVDFIFGAGQAVFNDCDIVSLDRGSATNNGYVTAPSTSISEPYGFLFVNSRLKKASPAMADNSVTLGRPWHPTTNLPDGTRAADPNAIGAVTFLNCWMDSHIGGKGWDAMSGKDKDGNTIWFNPQDSRFYEYGTTGPGALKSETRRLLEASQAQQYTIANVLHGWDPNKPTASTNPAQTLAAKQQTTQILADSFENGKVDEFPADWNILEKDTHTAQKSGVRIAAPPVKALDGKLALKLFSNPTVDAQANRDFDGLPQGRLIFYGMVPSTDPGFLSVELRNGGKRIFSIEMHPEARFRWRDESGSLQESNVKYSLDKWYQITLEWDATVNIWQAWVVDDSGKSVRLTPENGAQFAKETPGALPNRVQLRLNRATPGKVGYLDNFKLFKLE